MKVFQRIVFLTSILASSHAFTMTGPSTGTGRMMKRSVMTMKRGRGSLSEFKDSSNTPSSSKGVGSNKSGGGGLSSSTSSSSSSWIPVKGMTNGVQDLVTEDSKVILMDTMASALMSTATNPAGTVAVVKYGSSVYCTSVGCASCQIPLTKATVLPPNDDTQQKDPRLACSFCRATYNLRTGERVTTATEGTNLLSGVMKGLFSKQEANALPVYALGEKNGQVLINLGGAS